MRLLTWTRSGLSAGQSSTAPENDRLMIGDDR